ncbi:PucR family transcriptional regulator [Thermosediminibacter litoriperuensis]|uniref:Purine catabolism regulator n=1 Tax=Thermosediminibacter litoriperuensis TaxID=291989 RepID=A0A5S5AF57_9FIRM|nr:PucR family transcriptional regulator [Thermosediminibacter litoriperuensis]TYP48671.1 purine catabolism regulator [Thermosediminibacter litoriperuensis]
MDQIGITVKEVLEKKLLGSAELIAGETGLNKVITRVNIMEVPDIINWVKPGELLFTTVYSIKDDFEAQKALIPALHQKGLAAIGIKPGRYIKDIPDVMIRAADKLGFPLIKIPFEMTFPDLMLPILREIFDKQASFLERLDEVHEKLMNVVINGGGLKEITSTLSDLLKAHILIKEEVFGNYYFSSEEIKNIYEDSAKTLVCKRKGAFEYEIFEMEMKDSKVNVIKVPIMAAGQNYGEIFVFEKKGKITNFEISIIERTSTILAFYLTKEIAAKEVEMKYKSGFIDDLLSNDVNRRGSAVERGAIFGFDASKQYIVILLEIANIEKELRNINENSKQERLKNRIMFAINCLLEEKGAIIATKMDMMIILLPIPPNKMNDIEIKKYSKNLGKEILKNIQDNLSEVNLTLAMGRFYKNITDIYKSYQDAKKALMIGNILDKKNEVIHFDDLGIFRLFYQNSERDEMIKFYNEYIEPIVKYDENHGTELLKTLESYFKCNGNLKQISKDLYTHYNTIIYRIQKIQEILGVNLKDAKDRLNIEVALQIYKIIDKKQI